VNNLSYASWNLWYLGYPDRALQRADEACTAAETLAHPFSQVFALNYRTRVHQLRREVQATLDESARFIALCTEIGTPALLLLGKLWQGWALVQKNSELEVIPQISKTLTEWRASGAGSSLPYFLGLLAETYGKAGQIDNGLAAIEEALALVAQNDERIGEAELYRLKGELLLNYERQTEREKGLLNSGEAETCFENALDIARQQDAKSLELRAATSLARLWQRQGKEPEAHQLLVEVYHWFTEGFETPDLQEAKMLLDELSS
jgi:predicted ATPase